MKAHLLFPDQDFDWRWALKAASERDAKWGNRAYHERDFVWDAPLPWNWDDLTADLALDPILRAMAGGDAFIYEVCRNVLLCSSVGRLDLIQYRQPIVREALDHPRVVRDLYSIAVEALEKQKGHYLGSLTRYPDSVLRESVLLLGKFLDLLRRLPRISIEAPFTSMGWTTFFEMVRRELPDEYLDAVGRHLRQLRIQNDTLVLSAKPTTGGKGADILLHESPFHGPTWWARVTSVLTPHPKSYAFSVHPRDDAGLRALFKLRNRGVALVATALGQSAQHVLDFFGMLRAELAFYVGCINLSQTLHQRGVPTCFPIASESPRLAFRDLRDCSLSLTIDEVAGNDVVADGKALIIVTGANTGGKSTFLRSLGIAQLMMQAGMFVSATMFAGAVCVGVNTHYKREEDAAMESGKFDEELKRMSVIVDHLAPKGFLLLNESFSSTNEREGSEIGRQVIEAALDRGVRVICVTHQFELASRLAARPDSLSLRAERERTFRLAEGPPLPTSFGRDIYDLVFGKRKP